MLHGIDYFGFIYKWTNTRNGKYYVGSHHGSTDDGYIGSGVWFKRAYKAEPEVFVRVILEYIPVDDPMLTIEREEHYLLNECEVGNKDKCYNISRKAGGGWSLHGKSEEEIQEIYAKISRSLKNKPLAEKTAAIEKAKATIASQPERYAAAIQRSRETKHKWTEERRAQMVQKMRETLCLNPSIKEVAREKFKETIQSRTNERKREISDKIKAVQCSDDVKERKSRSIKISRARRPREEVEQVNSKISRSLLERDPAVKAESYRLGAEKFKNRSPEDKERSEFIRKQKWLAKKAEIVEKIRATKRKGTT